MEGVSDWVKLGINWRGLDQVKDMYVSEEVGVRKIGEERYQFRPW